MSAKDEIYAMGVAEGFVAALPEEDIVSRGRFEELVSLIMKCAEVSEDVARHYADCYWKVEIESSMVDRLEELYNKLNEIPGVYFAFIMGIITYAKKKPERLERVLNFIDSSDNLTTSDVVKFVSDQPDFREDIVQPRKIKEYNI